MKNTKSKQLSALNKFAADIISLRTALFNGWGCMDAAQLVDKERDYGLIAFTRADRTRLAELAIEARTYKSIETLWAEIPNHAHGATPDALIDADDRRPVCCVIAKRALRAAYDEEFDAECTIGDLLADLRHLCDKLGLDYAEMDRSALAHYRDELSKR